MILSEQEKQNLKKFNVKSLDEQISNDIFFQYKNLECQVSRRFFEDFETINDALKWLKIEHDNHGYTDDYKRRIKIWYCGYIYVPLDSTFAKNMPADLLQKYDYLYDMISEDIENIEDICVTKDNQGRSCYKIGFACDHIANGDYTRPFVNPNDYFNTKFFTFGKVKSMVKSIADDVTNPV